MGQTYFRWRGGCWYVPSMYRFPPGSNNTSTIFVTALLSERNARTVYVRGRLARDDGDHAGDAGDVGDVGVAGAATGVAGDVGVIVAAARTVSAAGSSRPAPTGWSWPWTGGSVAIAVVAAACGTAPPPEINNRTPAQPPGLRACTHGCAALRGVV